MKKKNVIKIIIFVSFFVFLLRVVEKILTPKWVEGGGGETEKYETFYELSPNTLDYIVLGSSIGYNSISPMQIYAQEGYTGYILSSPAQPIELSYYWLQEACKYQKPKYVFYDVKPLLYGESERVNGWIVRGMTYMKPSRLKIKAAIECKLPEMTEIELISPIYRFHSRWRELIEEDFDIDVHYDYCKGARLQYAIQTYTNKDFGNQNNQLHYFDENALFQIRGISDKNIEFFDKMYSFCKERDITLIPLQCPTLYWDDYSISVIKNFLQEYELELLDISADEININWSIDTLDSGNHVNYWGNCKTSNYLAKYLNDKQKLTDHKSDPVYERWNDDLIKYEKKEEENLRSDEEKILTFLQSIEKSKDKLCIIISVKDEMCTNWNGNLQNFMERLGLHSDFYNNIQNSYIGIIDGGEVKMDKFAQCPLVVDTTIKLNDEISINAEIKSGGYVYGNISRIKVEGKDYSMNSRGMNIVVIDKDMGKVLSSVCIDTCAKEWKYSGQVWDDELWKEYKENGMQVIEQGIYIISPADNQECAFEFVEDGNHGTFLRLEKINGKDKQQFQINYCGNGLYTICDVNSGKYMTVKDFGNEVGTTIIKDKYTGLSNQKWYIYENDNNKYTIMSHYNHKIFDVAGGKSFSGGWLQLYENYNGQWQQFVLKAV